MEPATVLNILVVTTVIWGIGGTVGCLPAAFSIMMLDAPGSEKRVATVATMFSLLTFPVVCWIAILAEWVCFHAAWYQAAIWLALLPLLNLLIFGGGAAWIHFFQRGKFN